MNKNDDKKQRFIEFDQFETLFFNELLRRSVTLYPSTSKESDNLFNDAGKKNRYVRRIIRLNSLEDLEWYKEGYEQLIALMKNWRGDDYKKPLDRHPVLYKNVSQINISVCKAFSSTNVPNEEDARFAVVRTGARTGILNRKCRLDDLHALYEMLVQYEPKIESIQNDDGTIDHALSLSCQKIHEKFAQQEGVEVGSFAVQARRRSGNQYKMRVRHEKQRLYKATYGFVVLDHLSTGLNINESLGQAERSDRLELRYKSMEIHGLAGVEFFMKKDWMGR